MIAPLTSAVEIEIDLIDVGSGDGSLPVTPAGITASICELHNGLVTARSRGSEFKCHLGVHSSFHSTHSAIHPPVHPSNNLSICPSIHPANKPPLLSPHHTSIHKPPTLPCLLPTHSPIHPSTHRPSVSQMERWTMHQW